MTKNMAPNPRVAPPPYIPRVLDLPVLLARKSHFLFGPRQTGKSFLIAHALPGVRVYDLLDSTAYLALSQNPARLAQELTPQDRLVVIDEIQRLPLLLNEVHRLIETRGIRFLLTGSSARSLRRGGINLLGGRARMKYLHPLTYKELGDKFDLRLAATRGLLPSIYFFDIGVVGALQGRRFKPGTPEFGQAFETLVFHELKSHSDYRSSEMLSYWRSTSGFEVDFIMGDHTAIEVKAKENISTQDLKP